MGKESGAKEDDYVGQRNRELITNILVVSFVLSVGGVLIGFILTQYVAPNQLYDQNGFLYVMLFLILYVYNQILSMINYALGWLWESIWKRVIVFQLLGILTLCLISIKFHVLAGAIAYSSFFLFGMLSFRNYLRENELA